MDFGLREAGRPGFARGIRFAPEGQSLAAAPKERSDTREIEVARERCARHGRRESVDEIPTREVLDATLANVDGEGCGRPRGCPKEARPLPTRLDQDQATGRKSDGERDPGQPGTAPDVADQGILRGACEQWSSGKRIDEMALDELLGIPPAHEAHARKPETELVDVPT